MLTIQFWRQTKRRAEKQGFLGYNQSINQSMSNFICNTCGKQFQNQNELIQHQRFEGTKPRQITKAGL